MDIYKARILELHKAHGLEVIQEHLSNWSGGRLDMECGGQDVIIAPKR